MKISPIASSIPTVNPNEGRSASADRVAQVKARLAGGTAGITPAPELAPAQEPKPANDIKRIKLKTNATPIAPVSQESNIPDPVEPTQTPIDDTKVLDPQLAAIAKEKRALQVKEREIAAREAALASKDTSKTPSNDDLVARLKSNPLSVLQEHGVTYDKLTEDLLADTGNNIQISRLESEIKALKEGLETQSKSLTERDAQAEQQALAQMKRDAEKIVAQDDNYEMVRATGSQDKVVELIHRIWKEKGEILDVTEALELVENDLIEQSLKMAQTKKIQSRLGQPQTAASAKPIRTLTNRDGTTVPMTSRERAIAAFQGRFSK